ncbi:unnamed protein product [Gongylonema pulchrum]|uniref:Secreted protein n=1 Tax=Gongylonema pulchrum TaxID=637853 RepID=A0A183DNM1_9BILA|nr:unnamed protein product [Gongylonema pulchrum]
MTLEDKPLRKAHLTLQPLLILLRETIVLSVALKGAAGGISCAYKIQQLLFSHVGQRCCFWINEEKYFFPTL